MALARHGTVGVTRSNVIWLDFDFECRQVDLSRRLGGKLTSRDMEKIDVSWLQSDLDSKWRNANWKKKSCQIQYVVYGACVHVACVSYLLIANANCEVVCVCILYTVRTATRCIEMNSGRNVDMTGWTELLRDNGWWMSPTAVCYWIITGQNAVNEQ